MSVDLKFQARTLSSRITSVFYKVATLPSLNWPTCKNQSSNHFTWLFRHTKASFQKLTTKQRRWGWGRENEITLATLILVIIIEALLFFFFSPQCFSLGGAGLSKQKIVGTSKFRIQISLCRRLDTRLYFPWNQIQCNKKYVYLWNSLVEYHGWQITP